MISHILLLQLPESLCYNQELNYTILIENSHGDLLAIVGPTLHIGPGLVTESITNVDWEQNQTYSLTVVLRLKTSSEAIISEKHLFCEYSSINISGIYYLVDYLEVPAYAVLLIVTETSIVSARLLNSYTDVSLLDNGSKSCRVSTGMHKINHSNTSVTFGNSTDGILYLMMTTSIVIAAVFLLTLLVCICICCKRRKNVEGMALVKYTQQHVHM